MKILIIGASGTIGKAIVAATSEHEIITANFNSGDIQVDLQNPDSIRQMFEKSGKLDAVVSAAGVADFAPLAELSDANFQMALQNKLMGQVNLMRFGQDHINAGGSITLTSGILSRHPMPGSAAISMANGALESFVKAAALEITAFRFNIVAPAFVKETMEMMGMDSSFGISAADTSKAYLAAINGKMHGETLDATDFV